jgi:prepilin-type N-terminal cleavage/methylation domain-containing protein
MVLMSRRFAARGASRAFSLVELMVVVAIAAVLAIVGVAMFRRHIAATRGTEAYGVIQAIRAAEASYLAENHVYLNVSTGTNWYPNTSPNTNRFAWSNSSHVDSTRWQQLAPAVNRSVMFGYLVNAGTPGTAMPALQIANSPASLGQPQPLDWYVIQAKGDTNGDGVPALYAATSLSGEIYVQNEGD